MPGCPKLAVILKAFLWTSSRGEGGYHVVAFMLFIFIYLYIHVYIHTSFFYSDQSLLWRYRGNILLFASVPIVPLRGAASSLRGTPLVPKLETSRPSWAIISVVAL